MGEQEIILYGAHWCPDCRRCKQFLGEHQIPYQSINIEQDPEAEKFVLEKNKGKRLIPMIVFSDGSFLVDPSNAELATKLGLKIDAARSHYDLIIIGGGPAGLTAAVYTAREAIDTLLIERAALAAKRPGLKHSTTCRDFPKGLAGWSSPIDFVNKRKDSGWNSCRLRK